MIKSKLHFALQVMFVCAGILCIIMVLLHFPVIPYIEKSKIIHDTVYMGNSRDVDIPVRITVYQPNVEQCDSTPMVTADGCRIIQNSYYSWCAVSRDLMFKYVNFGDTMVIEKNGVQRKLVVHDNMSSQWSWAVDVVIPLPDSCNSTNSLLDHLSPFLESPRKCKIIKIIHK